MPTAISIRNLSKSFGGPPVVDAISLDIAPGELFFLLGPSGCGKTTLLRMIAGFIEPSSGSIAFDGRDITHAPPNRRNTGMVFQSYALWPHMTVAQNVSFGLDIRKVPAADRARRVAEALAAVRMETYAGRKPNQLSGGQQQRIALARSLVIRPDVLLLDEPLSNLDAKLRTELRSEIRRICKGLSSSPSHRLTDAPSQPLTTIYVTHDQKEALSMADRVAILDRGRIVQIGTPADLYRKPNSRFVAEFLGETNFIPATVTATVPPNFTQLATAAGPLVSSHAAPGPDLLISIRPEALRLAPISAANTIRGILAESTYLGEMTQYLIDAPGNLRLRAAALNPPTPGPQPGQTVTLAVDPADAVLIPVP